MLPLPKTKKLPLWAAEKLEYSIVHSTHMSNSGNEYATLGVEISQGDLAQLSSQNRNVLFLPK
jgi:hypothetical protein